MTALLDPQDFADARELLHWDFPLLSLLSLDIAASTNDHGEEVALGCRFALFLLCLVVFKLQEAKSLLLKEVDVVSMDFRRRGAEFSVNQLDQFIRTEREVKFTAFWCGILGFGADFNCLLCLRLHNEIVSWREAELIAREMDGCFIECALLEESVLD